MHEFTDGTGYVQIFIHNDGRTREAVNDLMHMAFGKSASEASAFAALADGQDRIACGSYPPDVAEALLEAGQRVINGFGHRVRMTTRAGSASGACELCGALGAESEITRGDKSAYLCVDCVLAVRRISEQIPGEEFVSAFIALDWHFAGIPASQLVTRSREFPGHMRADVQLAIDKLFGSSLHFFGVHEEHRYETLAFAGLMKEGRNAMAIAPPQYHDVEVGDAQPVKCLQNGLWLCRSGELRYAALLSLHREYRDEAAIRIEIAVPTGAAGDAFVQRCFTELENAVHEARCYRGKILSLDGGAEYRGRSRGVTVHRLPGVGREEVILPEPTLALLDRNVLGFIANRPALRHLGQSTRKGILLYGPPGTGKTHTIRYLAANLPGHTTLIITAEQIGLLGAYMNLARLLQPAMVVIEDVDLIARKREAMGSCEEPLLNKLLNEMDGLKEDAEILFVLTTNRPEQLEGALAGRPGRIDQAIEVPLPDDIGRTKLAQLYGKGLPLDPTLVREIAQRTKGVSAAFIKELMRRIAQASIARNNGTSVESRDVSEALDDMLFSGGKLNVKLLGGVRELVEG